MSFDKFSAAQSLMSNPKMQPAFGASFTCESKMDAGGMKTLIMAIIALVVILILGNAIVPGAITNVSNTSAITGYSTWSSSTQSVWTSIAPIAVLVFFVIVLLVLVKAVDMV